MQEHEYITKETDLHSDVRKVKPDNGGGARNREGERELNPDGGNSMCSRGRGRIPTPFPYPGSLLPTLSLSILSPGYSRSLEPRGLGCGSLDQRNRVVCIYGQV